MFRRYGLPQAMFVDNGPPWASSGGGERWTRFGVWLLKLGVDVVHSRPYHPQGRGKKERFHRTLKAEVQAQRAFDRDGRYGVFFGSRNIASIDLTKPKSVSHAPEHASVISPG